MHALVVGGSGLVGQNVVRTFASNGHDVVGTYVSSDADTTDVELDKTDSNAVDRVVAEVDPDVVVDTAAFHAVDDCETDRDRAWAVNAAGTRNVARAADENDAHYVFISTDYVFPGDPGETPYRRSDRVDPINYYARSKVAGEQAARIAADWAVLRSSVIYGLSGDNFLTWALGELEDGEELGIVDDQISRPTYAPDLARACLDVARDGLTGLYHAAGPTSLSRYEFTVRLAEGFDLDRSLVSPITTEELGQEAPRPSDSSIDSSALYKATGRAFRSPTEAFEDLRTRRQ